MCSLISECSIELQLMVILLELSLALPDTLWGNQEGKITIEPSIKGSSNVPETESGYFEREGSNTTD